MDDKLLDHKIMKNEYIAVPREESLIDTGRFPFQSDGDPNIISNTKNISGHVTIIEKRVY